MSLGLPLEKERHESGPVHFACEIAGVHIALYAGRSGEALKRGDGGAAQFGFQVESVDEAVEAAKAIGASVLIEPEEAPWGRRAVVQDPDGRPVELNQAMAGDRL